MSNVTINTENTEIGKRLKKIRTFLNLSTEEMAEKIGVSNKRYNEFEAGTKELAASHITAIYSLNNLIDPEYLLTGKVMRDKYIEAAIQKMPDEEFRGIQERCKPFIADMQSFSDVGVVKIYTELAIYGQKHFDDENVRDYIPITFFTLILEEMLNSGSISEIK